MSERFATSTGEKGAKRYACLFSYLGTRYCGWQIQTARSGPEPSLQRTCEDAMEKIVGKRTPWQASGRTDAGVHAMGQVAHFTIDWGAEDRVGKPEITPYHLVRALNTLLPPDIRALAIREAPAGFHAQRDAMKKQYSYYVQTGLSPSALHAPFVGTWRGELDVAAMNESIRHLLGEHDFKPFQGAGSKPMLTTVREILEAEVVTMPNDGAFPLPFAGNRMVRIRVVGTGFLKHMVRGIAGTLLEVGTGKRPASDMAEILRRQDRSFVGPTASAQGLWMEKVWYPNLAFGP